MFCVVDVVCDLFLQSLVLQLCSWSNVFASLKLVDDVESLLRVGGEEDGRKLVDDVESLLKVG